MSEVRYCSETDAYAFYLKTVIDTKCRLLTALHKHMVIRKRHTSYHTAAPTAKTTNTFNPITPAVLVAQTHSVSALSVLPFKRNTTNCNIKNVKWPLKQEKQEKHTYSTSACLPQKGGRVMGKPNVVIAVHRQKHS